MKYPHWLVMSCVVTCGGFAASPGNSTEKPSSAWVAEFQRYASQDNLEVEYSYSPPRGGDQQFLLTALLRELPEPAAWPDLRRSFAAAIAQVPADEQLKKQRLLAGGWLLAYLMGDRAALEAQMKAAEPAVDSDDHSQVGYALQNLRETLSGRDEAGESPEKQLEAFERQLVMLEPVDEATVIRVLGGEENLARLKRMFAIGREMQGRLMQIYADFEKIKDEAAARAQAEAWQKEYQEKTVAEEQALAPFENDPLVQRYLIGLQQKERGNEPDRFTSSIYVPDLVKIAGPVRAEALLRRALKLPAKLEMTGSPGGATGQLAGKLALAEVEAVQVPSWGLVWGENATQLFEALRQKFPNGEPKDYGFRKACGYYLAGLVEQGRTTEAVKFVTEQSTSGGQEEQINLPYDRVTMLEQGHAQKLWEFLQAWLTVNPAVEEWDRFTRLSVVLDRRAELKTLLQNLAANGSFQGMNRLKVQQLQADADLATGEMTQAQTRLRALVEIPAEAVKERAVQMTICKRLLKLADLRDDSVGFGLALAAAEMLLEKGNNEKPDDKIQAAGGLATDLRGLGRYADSARIGRQALAQIAELESAAATKKDEEDSSLRVSEYAIKDILAVQLCAEVELDHLPAAAALLQENPWWGATDAVELQNRNLSCKGRPVGYYVARVAQSQGDLVLTRRMLVAQLVATPAVDSVYAAYIGLVGQDALLLLEKLAASDRYEERPLIWKARLQLLMLTNSSDKG